MSDDPPPSWRHRVAPHRAHRQGFARSHVSMGAMHAATLLATILATDKMKDPQARWVTIAGLGIASSIGEGIWREYIERERGNLERSERD